MIESIILNGIGTLFGEKSVIEIKEIGSKLKVYEKIHIINLFQIIVSVVIILITRNFKLALEFNFLILLAILLISNTGFSFFVMKAIEKADRSTNVFFGILTILLLLISDIALGYNVTMYHIVGILFVVITLISISFKKTINLEGVQFTLITQFFAFINITIVKYISVNYSSIEMLNIFLSVSFFVGSLALILIQKDRLQILHHLYQKKYIKIGLFGGLGGVFNSMGYAFGPASVITALKRIFSMFWGVVMGKIYFNENKFATKMISVGIISIGLIIMNIPAIIVSTGSSQTLSKLSIDFIKIF